MTNEERDLLLRDLCGRLHTFLYVDIKGNVQVLNSWADDDGNFFNFLDDSPDSNYGEGFTLDDVKPYLRPMSSMTEEERDEYRKAIDKDFAILEDSLNAPISYKYADGTVVRDRVLFNEVDWLNKNGFDYRGLIPMGLALEAKKDMYKNE